MAEGIPSLGKSILVPSVQELAATEALVTVPPRYVRPDQDPPVLSTTENNYHGASSELDLQGIPVINMDSLVTGDAKELDKLHLACQEWGFFQLVNHGISSTFIEKFKSQTQEFFNLPMEEKEKFWQTPDEIEGFGQAFVVSEDQKLDWADMFFLSMIPKQYRKPHLLPLMPLPYKCMSALYGIRCRETLQTYSAEVNNLTMKLLDYMGKALQFDKNFMKELFTEGHQSIRMNYYPPCPEPEKVIGLTPHSDPLALTILLQLSEIQGLQIRKEGNWIPITPVLPTAFIVNIGDALEIVTNGIYRSIEHRAVVNADKERLSVAAFHNPGRAKDICPAPCLVTPETPARFRSVGMVEFIEGLFYQELDGKSYLDSFRIENV